MTGTIRAVVLALAIAVATTLSGCGKEKQIAGIGDFTVDTSHGALSAAVELTFFRIDLSIQVPLPKLNGSFLQLGPAPDGKGTTLQLYAPFASMIGAIDGSLPLRGLPDGRPLVGTASPTLPSFDVTIERLSLRFYLAPDTFGVFIPLPLPAFSEPIQIPIKDARGYVVAYGAAIPPGQTPGSGGLLVLFPIVANANIVSL